MPGISHFSKDQIAERFAATIRLQDDSIHSLRSALRRIVNLEIDLQGDEEQIAANAISIAAHALKEE